MARKKSRDISVIRYFNQPVEIRPIKHITREFWHQAQDLFIANYQPLVKGDGARALPYDIAKFCSFAVARKGDQMVGFIKVIDLLAVERHYRDQGATISNQEAAIWAQDRPADLNSRQIEICWVHHRHRSQGIATRLYQYALTNLRATHIHIDPHRVWDNIDYWRGLGFTKCILYANGDPQPSTRLHIETNDDFFYDLSQYGLWKMYADRDFGIPLTPKQRQRALA